MILTLIIADASV